MKTFSQFIVEASYRSPEARALLDTIAGSESPGYDVIFGGSKFKDFSKHPEKDVKIPWRPGLTSNAAGRYQFLSTTYNPIAKKLGLKDFTPDSQDRAAWDLASTTYGDEQKLRQALRKDPVGVASRLSGQWTSLPGGIERNAATDSFEKRFRSQLDKYDKEGLQPPTTPTVTPKLKPTVVTPPKPIVRQTIQDKGGKGGSVSTNTAYKTKLGGVKATSTRGETGTQVIRAQLKPNKPSNPIASLFKPKAGSTERAVLGGVKGTVQYNKDGTRSFTAVKPTPKQ